MPLVQTPQRPATNKLFESANCDKPFMQAASPALTIADWSRARPRAFWGVVALMATLVIGTYCVTAAAYVNHDVFVMAEVAQSVLGGKTLYGTACWDNKPPLTLLAYAIPQLVFPRSYLAIQGFLGVWLVLQAAVFAYFLRNEPAVATILGAVALVFVPLLDKEFLWASSEHWHNLFALLVILPSFQLWKNPNQSLVLSVLAGTSIVLAMHCRQTGVLLTFVPLVSVAGSRIELHQKAVLLAGGIGGAIAAWLAVLALCASIGDLNGYFDAMFLAPGRYSDRRIGALFETAYFYVATYRSSALGLLMLASLIGSARRSDFALISLVACVTGLLVIAPARHHAHYMMQTLPLLALCVQASVARLNTVSPAGARAVSLAITSFLMMNGLFAAATLPQGRAASTMTDLAAVANAVRTEARPAEKMFAVGTDSAYLYFATDIAMVHPIFWDMFFGRLSRTIPYPVEDVIARYVTSVPDLLVIRDDAYAAASAATAPPPDVSPCQQAVDLCRQLEQHNTYREVSRLRGWVILRRIAKSSEQFANSQ